MAEDQMAETGMDDVFSFTRSSGLNSLIEEAKNIYNDEFDPDFFIDDYRDKLQKFRELSEKLREFHGNLQKIQEDAPVIVEQGEIIRKNFDVLLEGLRKMEEYLEYREKETILEGLRIVKQANNAIFAAVDFISQEDASREKLSKSPYVHDLIRVARGVISKGFPREALKEKLEALLSYSEGVYRDFHIYKTARFETAAIQDRITEMETALDKYREGLQEMEHYFSDENEAHIEKGIALVKEGSDVLVDSYELIQRELAASGSKYCVKCGEENPLTSKFCSKCSALLPESQQGEEGGGDTAAADTGQVLTSNIIRLADAVNDYTEGRSSEQELLKVIEWMEEKVQAGISGLQNMAPLESAGAEEGGEDLQRVGALFEEGTYELQSALATMKSFFQEGDPGRLRDGLSAAVAAAHKLYQVQERCTMAGAET